MSLPDLCLLPHEAGDLAPGELLCAPAEARARLWKWRCGGNYLFRRVAMAGFPTEWVARREAATPPPLLRLFWPPDGQIDEIVSIFKKGKFLRVIYLNEQIQLATSPKTWRYALYFSPEGVPVWNSPNGEKSAFCWNDSQPKLTDVQRFNSTDSTIEDELSKMLENSDCDCALALRWLQLSRDEKDRQIYRVRRGTLDEFKALLRVIVWSENSGDKAQTWTLFFSTPTLNVSLKDGDSLESLFVSGQSEILPSARHKRLLELARREFGLHYALDLVKRRSGLPQVAWSDYVLDIKIPVPTAHQQLEAKLLLRDWLRDKVSPAELAELMPR